MPQSTIFVCQQCGKTSPKWEGRCSACGAWNSMVEEVVTKTHLSSPSSRVSHSPVALEAVQKQKLSRVPTGIDDVDKVLGGGIVPGSLILLGGEPGIGKSTMLMQIAARIPSSLYVTGEESLEQVSDRAERLGIKSGLQILQETDLYAITDVINSHKPPLIIIDSIQTMANSDIPGVPGSIVQVRGAAQQFQALAKSLRLPIILVGHVTKEGTIAGPRTLEHIVDVVLSFEGDAFQQSRILRGVKNRFGATNEVAILSMTEQGLTPVENPSALFLSDHADAVPGSAVTAILEGRKPLLLEVQALTVPTSFGYPKRTAVGLDLNRLNVLTAVLQRRAGLKLEAVDIYVNVVGGIKLADPGADLAVCAAIASAMLDRPLKSGLCLVGEVGLLGEIRPVSRQVDRLKEAKRLGYAKMVTAKSVSEALKALFDQGPV